MPPVSSPPPPTSSGASNAQPSPGAGESNLRKADQNRLASISTDASESPETTLRALLKVGLDGLGVQNGHLTQIHPGMGTHTVVALAGVCSSLEEGNVHDLSSTYCRSIIASNALVSLHDASTEGWADDRAYQTFGFDCYVGTKVLVSDQLYGTVCFTDPEPRSAPFSQADHVLVREIARRLGLCLCERPSSNPQTELERSRNFLRRVQDHSKVGGWEIDFPSGELRWTETTYDLFDLPLNYEPDVESAISFFAEEAQAELRTALDRCLEDGSPYNLELPLITAEGTHRWVRTRGIPSHENGTVTRITGTIEDITAEKEAQRALEEERDRFETLFQSLPTPVARCRVEEDTTPITAINEAFEDVFGVSRSSAEGADINELLVAEPQRNEAQNLSKRALEEGTLQAEVERRAADGLRDFRLQVAGRCRPEAPPEVYSIYTDITELKERERTIRKERDLLNRVLETSPTAIVIFDQDGNFVRASDRAQEILGMEIPQVMERTYDDPEWNLTTPAGDPLPDRELPFARVKDAEEPLIGAEHTIECPDGTRRLLSVSGAPLHDATGTFVGAVFHLDDITEQRQMGQRLLEVQDEERRRIDQELHDEMGGLLTTLQMTVELGRIEAKRNAAPTERFDEIEELVSQISAVTHTVSRRLHPKDLDDYGLSRALSTLVKDLQKQHDIQIHLQTKIEEGERYSSLLEVTTFRIVQEALVNVIRHANTDAAEVTIDKGENTLRLSVLDEGAGFDPSAQPTNDAYGLHGIRERVERLNGTLDIDSAKNEGTRLTATLPQSVSSLPA